MTSDEAIQILKTWRITGDKAHAALDMAIEALAKDINVPINDCISREAAIDALAIGEELLKRVLDDMDVVGNEREKYEWGLGLIESYISDMKELPSAQPERKNDDENRRSGQDS